MEAESPATLDPDGDGRPNLLSEATSIAGAPTVHLPCPPYPAAQDGDEDACAHAAKDEEGHEDITQDPVDGAVGRIRSGHRPPRTLFDCAAAFVAARSLSFLSASKQDTAATERVRSLVASLPPSLADAVVRCIVKAFVEQHGEDGAEARARGDGPGEDPLQLVDILGEGVTTVDLSPLVRLGQRPCSELGAFSARFVAALPRLAHLTRLNLGTHGQRFTLPVCADQTLAEVARCCPRLRSLDVSRNSGVSATSLLTLSVGCPLLEELVIFDCVLPCAVLAALLVALPRLRVLGHQEVGAAVAMFWQQADHQDRHQDRARLLLTQVVNLGETAIHRRKSGDEATRLRCRGSLVRTLRACCPDLDDLRVRVLDEDVRHLAQLPHLQRLELRFHAAPKPSSLGPHTLKYLGVHGANLTALTVYSHRLLSTHFDLIGAYCPQLRQLWMRCNQLEFSADAGARGGALPTRPFTRLESLSIRVGWDERCVCRFPVSFLEGLVRHVAQLRQLYVAVNSEDVTDAWLGRVLDALECSALQELFVLLPNNNHDTPFAPRLALTPASVRLVCARCPALEQLGNLLVWSFQQEEVRHLQQQLRASNSALRLVAKEYVWR